MLKDEQGKAEGALVTVLMPTFNRRRYFPFALESVLRQTYGRLEIIVINDGGESIADIVGSANDPRIVFIDRQDNRGKAYSLNEALGRARGKYIAYLDDDDIFYPFHVERLIRALEANPGCGVAYSDLYKTHCRIEPDGRRTVLSKILEVSRDFDRYFLLYFNHVLHVSLMHSRELLEKTGLYNEELQVLIDWDMTRRLSFFSDFIHVAEITGEYFGPVGECDRISVQMRKDTSKYITNVLKIRSARPAKPWPKIKDLSLIFVPTTFDETVIEQIKSIWLTTFYVFRLYLPFCAGTESQVSINLPNLIRVRHDSGASYEARVDRALAACESEYVAIVPQGIKHKQSWVEDPLYALMRLTTATTAIELDGTSGTSRGAVFRTEELRGARSRFGAMPFWASVQAAGITVRKPGLEELPFKFDDLLERARTLDTEGSFRDAAQAYEYIAEHCGNSLWMHAQAARAWYRAGDLNRAERMLTRLHGQRQTPDTLLLESKIHRKRENYQQAIKVLEEANAILEGTQPIWK